MIQVGGGGVGEGRNWSYLAIHNVECGFLRYTLCPSKFWTSIDPTEMDIIIFWNNLILKAMVY